MAAQPTDGRKLRVLVVEDEPMTAKALGTILSAWGHDVQIAFDGESALQLSELEAPDVAFLDLGLPGMDGLEVAAALRRKQEPKRALLIALTGHGTPEDLERSKAAGIDLHLVKPVIPAELEGALHRFKQIVVRQ
jgi:CheY-like chemotaxis protein